MSIQIHSLRRSRRRYFLNEYGGAAYHPTALSWAGRVITNGGAAPADTTLRAASVFCYALDNTSLTSLMLSVNMFAPDNLIASITPLIKTAGNDPWTNHSFVSGDLTVAGLKGDGNGAGVGTKYLDTGVVPTTAFGNDTSAGVTLYNSGGSAGASVTGTFGSSNVAFTNNLALKLEQAATTYFECFNVTGAANAGYVNFASSGFFGFVSGNRTGAAAGSTFIANSSTAITTKGTFTGSSGTRPAFSMFSHALNVGGSAANFDPYRLSFASIHLGLTLAQATDFFNAVQALRMGFGGGYI